MPPKVNILRGSSPGAITEVVSLSGVGLIMTEKDKEQKRKEKNRNIKDKALDKSGLGVC
jgi:hypothetical protein